MLPKGLFFFAISSSWMQILVVFLTIFHTVQPKFPTSRHREFLRKLPQLLAETITSSSMTKAYTPAIENITTNNTSLEPSSSHSAAKNHQQEAISWLDNSTSLESTSNRPTTLPPPLTLPTQSIIESNQNVNIADSNRLRWIDLRRHQGYPPRMPHIPGIPSGLRNPLVTPNPSVSTIMTTVSSTSSNLASSPLASFSPTGVVINNNQGPLSGYFPLGISQPSMIFGSSSALEDEMQANAPVSIRRYNITRVEHIVAECSEEYMKVVVRFNGTFTGLIYSSGYVHDRNCIYVNGSGRNYYEFFIRLNQCGTLGRQEMYHPTMPGEARRRDQLMWNTLSIQYNALIEEEFDEHFRLTCEYGSDFWKTVSFPSVNVEINTGSPVVFTINPPQCQMEIRRGFGIGGTRTTGPVIVGDPLTLLIHMKSEKVGFDILVKNCIAHNGAKQRMQLIDTNGCVTDEKLISPFRGTYNSDNGHQVSLYSYLKAFRFTGSPALYLECDIHMCHNRCPALEVHHEKDEVKSKLDQSMIEQMNKDLVCLRSSGLVVIFLLFVLLMSISLGSSICYCLRMRKIKYIQRDFFKPDYGASRSVRSTSSLSSNGSIQSSPSLFNPYPGNFSRFQ